MAELPFQAFALKFGAWAVSRAPGALASAALDVEATILGAAFTVDQVHVWAHATGSTGSREDLLQVLGGYYVYSGLLPSMCNNKVPPPACVGSSGLGGGRGGVAPPLQG